MRQELINTIKQAVKLTQTQIPLARLLDQAPARRDVLSLAAIYAITQNDYPLQKKLISQGQKLDLISNPVYMASLAGTAVQIL